MKISKINTSPAFAKKPLLTCKIKSSANKEENNAVLYKLNPNDKSDYCDVKYSKTAQAIFDDFKKDNCSDYHEYYMLQNSKTQEVISCAKTSRHYRCKGANNTGFSTYIETFAENDKYINGGEPLLAYIIKNANERYDKSVYSVDVPGKIPNAVKSAKFKKTENDGITFMPKRSYNHYLNVSEMRSKINYNI